MTTWGQLSPTRTCPTRSLCGSPNAYPKVCPTRLCAATMRIRLSSFRRGWCRRCCARRETEGLPFADHGWRNVVAAVEYVFLERQSVIHSGSVSLKVALHTQIRRCRWSPPRPRGPRPKGSSRREAVAYQAPHVWGEVSACILWFDHRYEDGREFHYAWLGNT